MFEQLNRDINNIIDDNMTGLIRALGGLSSFTVAMSVMVSIPFFLELSVPLKMSILIALSVCCAGISVKFISHDSVERLKEKIK